MAADTLRHGHATLLLFASSWALWVPWVLASPVVTPGTSLPPPTNELSKRAAPDYNWVALGDSYSAGPGSGAQVAGTASSCYATDGSYPVNLQDDFPMANSRLQFLSCTGNVVQDMIDNQVPQIGAQTQLATLSIGGNDLHFTDVLVDCILQPKNKGDCPAAIAEVDDILDNKLQGILYKAYDSVFQALGNDPRRKVFVQLYPTFFDATDTWCNSKTVSVVWGNVKLTQDLRIKMNGLGQRVTAKMREIIEAYHYDHLMDWAENRLFYLDGSNNVYDNHRICEPSIRSVDDTNIWLWTTKGYPFTDDPGDLRRSLPAPRSTNDTATVTVSADCINNSRYKTDLEFRLDCDFAELNGTSASTTTNSTGIVHGTTLKFWDLRKYYLRMFHPKPDAFDLIASNTRDAIRYLAWPAEVHSEVGLGELQCKGERKLDVEGHVATRDRLIEVRDDFCKTLAATGFQDTTYDDNIHVSALDGTRDGCPTFDHTAPGFEDMCKERLNIPIDECDVGTVLLKKGGSFFRDCIVWYISAGPLYRKLRPDVTDPVNYENKEEDYRT